MNKNDLIETFAARIGVSKAEADRIRYENQLAIAEARRVSEARLAAMELQAQAELAKAQQEVAVAQERMRAAEEYAKCPPRI